MTRNKTDVEFDSDVGYPYHLQPDIIKMALFIHNATSEQEKIEQMFGVMDNPDDPCSTTNLSIQTNVANISEKDLGNIDDDYDAGF